MFPLWHGRPTIISAIILCPRFSPQNMFKEREELTSHCLQRIVTVKEALNIMPYNLVILILKNIILKAEYIGLHVQNVCMYNMTTTRCRVSQA